MKEITRESQSPFMHLCCLMCGVRCKTLDFCQLTSAGSVHRETKVITMHNWKIGVCHGHQIVPWGDKEAIGMLRRQLDVDVCITGHTHEMSVDTHEDSLLINPGSATGAYSGLLSEVVPSFCLLDVQEGKLTVYVYQLHPSDETPGDWQLKVQEFKHAKH